MHGHNGEGDPTLLTSTQGGHTPQSQLATHSKSTQLRPVILHRVTLIGYHYVEPLVEYICHYNASLHSSCLSYLVTCLYQDWDLVRL